MELSGRPEFYRKPSSFFEEAGQSSGTDASGSKVETPMSFILGYSTLSKANWLFDFPNRRWAITKMVSKG